MRASSDVRLVLEHALLLTAILLGAACSPEPAGGERAEEPQPLEQQTEPEAEDLVRRPAVEARESTGEGLLLVQGESAALTEAELDALGFKLTGVLRDEAGRVPKGRIHYLVSQFPERIFSGGEATRSGAFECDAEGAFEVHIPGYRPIDAMPMRVRLSPSQDVVRGWSHLEPQTNTSSLELLDVQHEGSRMQRIAERSMALDLGEVSLQELPHVTQVWLTTDGPSELECGISVMPSGPFGGAISVADSGHTLRAGEVLDFYTEAEGQDLWITADLDSGWALSHSVVPIGSRQALEPYRSSVTTLIVREEDHPDACRWKLIPADEYPPDPVVPTEQWDWETLVYFRTSGGWGGRPGPKPQVCRDLYPQAYKVLIWSKEPTPDGMPIRVFDLELGSEDRRVRVR
jgi:hypothetical protein